MLVENIILSRDNKATTGHLVRCLLVAEFALDLWPFGTTEQTLPPFCRRCTAAACYGARTPNILFPWCACLFRVSTYVARCAKAELVRWHDLCDFGFRAQDLPEMRLLGFYYSRHGPRLWSTYVALNSTLNP